MANLSSDERLQRHLSDHRMRAIRFLRKADKYRVSDGDISLICSFYAAYHAMRLAILSDPAMLSIPPEISRVAPHITPDARWNSHHNAPTRSLRGPGVRNIVDYLYREYSYDYARLHENSVIVRYVVDNDWTPESPAEACARAERIVTAALSGELKYQH